MEVCLQASILNFCYDHSQISHSLMLWEFAQNNYAAFVEPIYTGNVT